MRGARSKRRPPGPILGYEGRYPIVPVSVQRHRKGNLFHLAACPYCGEPHVHGAGDFGDDPRDHAYHRGSHCVEPVPNDVGYILRIVGDE
jgi:hypothetical protein